MCIHVWRLLLSTLQLLVMFGHLLWVRHDKLWVQITMYKALSFIHVLIWLQSFVTLTFACDSIIQCVNATFRDDVVQIERKTTTVNQL